MSESSTTTIGFSLPWLRHGGTETAMVRVMNELAQDAGLRIVLAVHEPGGSCSPALHERVQVTCLGGSMLSLPSRYQAWLSEEKPVAVFSAINHMNLVNAWCGGATRAIATVHNHLEEKLKRTGKPGERLVKECLLRMLMPRAYRVVGVSEEIRQYLVEGVGLDDRRTIFIPPPIPVADIRSKAALPVELPNPGQRKVVVGSGRMATQKGFDVLLKALALQDKVKRPCLWLLGDGELLEEHRQLAKSLSLEDDVLFLGRQDNPFPFVARADCFALSSRWEGFPLVLLEAMALGKPIVACDCRSGPREILAEGKFGILSDVDDPEALARGMVEALDRQWNAEALMKRAEEFDVGRVALRYRELALA